MVSLADPVVGTDSDGRVLGSGGPHAISRGARITVATNPRTILEQRRPAIPIQFPRPSVTRPRLTATALPGHFEGLQTFWPSRA